MKDQDAKMFEYTSWLTKHGGFARDMTIRDYFAAKAMPALFQLFDPQTDKYWELAKFSYKMADAMLKAREE